MLVPELQCKYIIKNKLMKFILKFCGCVVHLYLKGLNEGPEQNANGPTLPQELNETSCSEESQKTQVYEVFLKMCVKRGE